MSTPIWDLPELLQPLPVRKKPAGGKAKPQPFYAHIIRYLWESPWVTAEQVRRRLPNLLKSGRSTRRHLQAMVTLGLIGTVHLPTPHAPFIYHARRRGLAFLQDIYAKHGIAWTPSAWEEAKSRPRSPAHLLHEIGISEFQLNVHQSLNGHENLCLRLFERRFRRPDRRLYFTHKGKQYSLIPDAGFLIGRQSTPPAFVPFTFLEFDAGTMTLKQMKRKFDTYAHWMRSAEGHRYLIDLYAHHGAANPRPEFRVVVIASDKLNAEKHDRRMIDIVMATLDQPVELRHRLWFTSVADLKVYADDERPLAHAVFLRGRDMDPWLDAFRALDDLEPPKDRTSSPQQMRWRQKIKRTFLELRIAEQTRHCLFPL